MAVSWVLSRWLIVILTLGLVALAPLAAQAVEPSEILADKALEARARDLSAQLRCVVCQNQSIDDSNAPLARDLRILVRERLVAGDTNEEVLSFLVARYGEFVLLKPPVGAHTLLLWLAPLLLLAAVLAMVGRRVLAQRSRPDTSALTPDERERLEALLATEKRSSKSG